jgi:hypothetical protein
MKKYLRLLLVPVFLTACNSDQSPIESYNQALLALEERLKECDQLEQEPVTGEKGEGIELDVIRIGLSYFYIKNAQKCIESQRLYAIQSIENIEESENVAEVIRFNAKHLKKTLIDDEALTQAQANFDALSNENEEALNELSVAHRSFKVDLAIEYYIDSTVGN